MRRPALGRSEAALLRAELVRGAVYLAGAHGGMVRAVLGLDAGGQLAGDLENGARVPGLGPARQGGRGKRVPLFPGSRVHLVLEGAVGRALEHLGQVARERRHVLPQLRQAGEPRCQAGNVDFDFDHAVFFL